MLLNIKTNSGLLILMHGVISLPGVTYDKNYLNNFLSKYVLGALKKCLREMFLLSTQSMYVMLRKAC